jgi:hypothetical protein
MTTRRNVLMSTLFGAGYVGLRALATGIPASVLMHGTKALAADPASCAAKSQAQYIILQTSAGGDPINANAPGTYATSGPISTLAHPKDAGMVPTALTLGSTATTAAKPWATPAAGGVMPQSVLDRTSVWHIMTGTPIHPKEPDVLGLFGATTPNEMLPSLLAKALQPCLGTIQPQPICIGAASPGEQLTYGGHPLPVVPPIALKDTLTSPGGVLVGLSKLQTLRDDTLSRLADMYVANGATKAQKAYVESMINSQSQLRSINQDLLAKIGSLKDNLIGSQIAAAIVLIQMNVSAVISIHIPFGGDNHFDSNLSTEAAQTPTGMQSIADLMTQLQTATNANGSLIDQVSFLSLNVFGRTLGPANTDGRQHNGMHQLSLAIGKPFAGGIIGGVGPVGNDFGAVSIDSMSGAANGDIAPTDTLASFGKTMLSAVGIDQGYIDSVIPTGKVVKAALA